VDLNRAEDAEYAGCHSLPHSLGRAMARPPVMTEVARFTVSHTRFLDVEGRVTRPLPAFAGDGAALADLYKAMVLTRTFDAKAVSLQRTGRLGTFASSLGQEAVAVGLAAAMHPEDVLVPSFREQGAQFLRGVTMTELLLYWGGDERGSDFAGPREDFPICVPVGTHVPHAAGVALAFKLRGEPRVVVCAFGDGATSRGDVYEALNFAALHAVPAVFVINNNQWAISVPRARQTAAETLAQKAVAAGMPGCQVDGNDVIAVRQVIGEAIERARVGGGPTLVEALTYRLSDHTTADDASRYRDDAEVSARWKEDPIARLRRYLSEAGRWSKAEEEALIADCTARVEAAIEDYLATSTLPPTAMFEHLYAELPAALADQRAELAGNEEP
jgi:2-oxoisovalerate dehydrogenase E1 component alpha subunit